MLFEHLIYLLCKHQRERKFLKDKLSCLCYEANSGFHVFCNGIACVFVCALSPFQLLLLFTKKDIKLENNCKLLYKHTFRKKLNTLCVRWMINTRKRDIYRNTGIENMIQKKFPSLFHFHFRKRQIFVSILYKK